MNLQDLTEITALAELLRARCEAAGAPYTSISFAPGRDLDICITGQREVAELIRLGAEPMGQWRPYCVGYVPDVANRQYRLGVFHALRSVPLDQCDVTEAIITPRADVVPA